MNREALERSGADIIAEGISSLLEKKDKVILAVPGGRSVSGIFANLKSKTIDWTKVHIFMVDERLVPIDDDESNFKLAKKGFIQDLIDKGKLPLENVHPFILEDSSDFGVSKYAEELKRFGGKYDIILLSSGEDGHIGALYPCHHSIDDDSEFYIFMEDSPKLPKKRMSMSRRMVLKSEIAVILFFGEGKRRALEKFNNDEISYTECPNRLVKEIKRHFILSDIEGLKNE